MLETCFIFFCQWKKVSIRVLVFKVWVICFPLALNYIIQTFRILTQAGSQPRISVNQLFAQLGPGVHTGYWPSVRLRWLDIGCLWTEIKSRSVAMQKKNKANIQPSWPNKLGQYRIYYNGIKHQKMILWSCRTKREILSGQYSSSCLLV